MEPAHQFPQQQQMGPPGSEQGGAGARGFKGTAENAKTRMCNRWLQGDCRFGDRCNFAHGEHELRTLPARSQGGGFQQSPTAGGPGAMRPGGGRGQYADYSAGRPPSAGYGGRGPGGYGGGYGGYGADAGRYGDPYQGQQAPGMGQMQQHAQPQMMRHPQEQQQQQQELWPAPMEGPNGWFMYRCQDTNEPYYYHAASGTTTWDKPPEWR